MFSNLFILNICIPYSMSNLDPGRRYKQKRPKQPKNDAETTQNDPKTMQKRPKKRCKNERAVQIN